MKRIPPPLGVTIIILAGLLFSSVMAQTGSYSISSWVVAGGGGSSTGGVYGLDGTIGQAAAGRVSGGAYTLDSGYWALDETGPVALTPAPNVYLPMIQRALPTPTPTVTPTPEVLQPCNDVEPNDSPDEAKPFLNIGKGCIGSFMSPTSDDEDWYSVNLGAGQTITVDLTNIPAQDDYDIYLYDNIRDTIVAESDKGTGLDEKLSFQAPFTQTYYVWVVCRPKVAPTHTYVLKVTIQ